MSNLVAMVSDDTITAYINGKSYVAPKDHPSFHLIREKLTKIGNSPNDEAVADLIELFNSATAIKHFSQGAIRIEDGVFLYGGKPYNNHFSKLAVKYMKDGLDFMPLIRLIENLEKNPSYRCRNDIPQWMEKSEYPITSDGYILALKRVRRDYKDCHSGTVDNSVGQKPFMDRSLVDDDMNNTCSAGFHFCNDHYIDKFYGERVMVVKIHPKDIVAFPRDYGLSKARCNTYEVVAELENGIYGVSEAFSESPLVWHVKPRRREHTKQVAINTTIDDMEPFVHHSTGKEFTARQILSFIERYSSKNEIHRKTGIPPRTLTRWLIKIDEATNTTANVESNDQPEIHEF
tara:strand:- start:1575 stop:2612 length:1038 start_codon:yes stop_codon:yes gene_type:complete